LVDQLEHVQSFCFVPEPILEDEALPAGTTCDIMSCKYEQI